MKYECYITDQDMDLGWVCPIDNSNETETDDCDGCPFAKEVE